MAIEYSTKVLEDISCFNYKLRPNSIVSLHMAKSGFLNEDMRRKTHGSSSQSNMLVTKIRGKVKKRN